MRVLAALLAIGCGVGVAHAEDKPWADGVSEAAQTQALELYRKGNELFEQALYLEALQQYEVALRSWDHPSIRYNAAVCLINLGRDDEAYDNLMAALRFGGAPLSKELQQQAHTYEGLLTRRLAELEVQCKEPQAKVMLDDKQLIECPGTQTRKLKPGLHQVVGEKPGYETDSRAIELPAGKKTTLVLELKVIVDKGRLERRWNKYLPYGVFAGGIAVGLVTVPFALKALSARDERDEQFRVYCPNGCKLDELDATQRADLDEIEGRKKQWAGLAYTTIAVGAVGIVAGLTMVVLNQPRFVAVTPQVGKDHASLSLVGRW